MSSPKKADKTTSSDNVAPSSEEVGLVSGSPGENINRPTGNALSLEDTVNVTGNGCQLIEDAYFSISITPTDRKFLRFQWRGTTSLLSSGEGQDPGTLGGRVFRHGYDSSVSRAVGAGVVAGERGANAGEGYPHAPGFAHPGVRCVFPRVGSTSLVENQCPSRGRWSLEEAHWHINALELHAAWL